MAALEEERVRHAASQDGRIAALEAEDATGIRLRDWIRRGEEPANIIRDVKHKRTTVANAFYGAELVRWLMASRRFPHISTEEEAVMYGQTLVDSGIIHHVQDKAGFQNDEATLYRFRVDDGSFLDQRLARQVHGWGTRLYLRLHGLENLRIIRDQTHHMKTYASVFQGSDLIDFLLDEGDVDSRNEDARDEGRSIGAALLNAEFIEHVFNEHEFEDKALFYRFRTDKVLQALPTAASDDAATNVESATDRGAISSGQSLQRKPSKATGVAMAAAAAAAAASPHPSAGFRLGHVRQAHIRQINLDMGPSGFGFVLSGERPPWVRAVDSDSAAARAGIIPGDYIVRVNSQDVTRMAHTAVVDLLQGTGDVMQLSLYDREAWQARVESQHAHAPQARRMTMNGDVSPQHSQAYIFSSVSNKQITATERLVESMEGMAAVYERLKLLRAQEAETVALLSKPTDTGLEAYRATALQRLRQRIGSYKVRFSAETRGVAGVAERGQHKWKEEKAHHLPRHKSHSMSDANGVYRAPAARQRCV
jgi:hypothetical protein